MSKDKVRIYHAYATTYCNKAHCLQTGRPIEHECFTLPIAALVAEMRGDYALANRMLENARRTGGMRLNRGIKINPPV